MGILRKFDSFRDWALSDELYLMIWQQRRDIPPTAGAEAGLANRCADDSRITQAAPLCLSAGLIC